MLTYSLYTLSQNVFLVDSTLFPNLVHGLHFVFSGQTQRTRLHFYGRCSENKQKILRENKNTNLEMKITMLTLCKILDMLSW